MYVCMYVCALHTFKDSAADNAEFDPVLVCVAEQEKERKKKKKKKHYARRASFMRGILTTMAFYSLIVFGKINSCFVGVLCID